MAKYAPRRGSRSDKGRGGRGGSKYGSGRSGSRYGGRSSRGGREDDDYYDEEPAYYGKGAKSSSHEQYGVFIFIGAIAVVIITVIFIAAGGGQATIEKAIGVEKGGYYEKDAREMTASDALGRAEAYDKANPYEDKDVVAQKYQEVASQYAGTVAAGKASQKAAEVLDRRR
jgi:hypothetical protein